MRNLPSKLPLHILSIVRLRCVTEIGRFKELVPAISLYSELLLCSAYFASSVGVKVGLFEADDEVLDVVGCGFDERLLTSQPGCNSAVRVYPNSPVEVIIAVFELLDEGDGLVVGGPELPPHSYSRYYFTHQTHTFSTMKDPNIEQSTIQMP